MTAEQFAYWLQGYAELNPTPPTAEQWQAIREHLAIVFHKVTPSLGEQPAQRFRGLPAGYPSSGGVAVVSAETMLTC